MEINRGNYEVFFLDYYENRLEHQQVAELMVFLQENPDLNNAFESYESVILEPESVSFEVKEGLKKQEYKPVDGIDAYNYEEWLIAGMEGDLSEQQTISLNRFFSENPNARLEKALFQKTRMIPGPVVYEKKNSLKKRALFVVYKSQGIAAIAVAASIVLLTGIYFGSLNLFTDSESNSLTSTEKMKAPLLQTETGSVEEINLRSVHRMSPLPDQTPSERSTREFPIPGENAIPEPMHHQTIHHISVSLAKMNTPQVRNTKYTLFLIQEVRPEEIKPGFVGRFMQGLFRKAIPKMGQKSFVEYTLDGYNLMSDREVELEKEYDETGKVIAYRINGENIRIGQKVRPSLEE